jgi:uncharacterized protein YndB with AHSA1/START domain
MNIDTKTALRLTRIIHADRARVFKAWTTPEDMKKWSAPEGSELADCSVDLRVGGSYRLHMRTDEGATHTAIGVYREIDRPSRLVYTWDWEEEEMHMGDTLVTVEFNDLGHSTEVVITHEKFPAEQAREGHDIGWKSCLNRLEAMFPA